MCPCSQLRAPDGEEPAWPQRMSSFNPLTRGRGVEECLFMARRLTFAKPDGSQYTTRSGEKANSGAPPLLVAFGDYDAMRLREFAAEHDGALVDGWKLYGATSLFGAAAE
jgi:hypothetical protein